MTNRAVVKLTADRAAKVSYMELLAKRAEEANRVFTDEEKGEYEATKAAIAKIDEQVKAYEEIEQFAKSQAVPVNAPSFGSLPRAKQNREKGIGFARCAIAMAQAKGVPHYAAEIARDVMKDHEVAAFIKAAVTPITAAGETEIQNGAYLAGEFLELLRPRTIVGRMPVRKLSFDGAPSLRIPGAASGVAGGYLGESGEIKVEKVTTKDMTLTPSKLAVIVPATAEILRRSTPSLEVMILEDMLRGTARTIDAQFLHGAPSDGPAGLLTRATTDGTVFDTAGATIDNVIADFKKATTIFRNANLPFDAPVWVISEGDLNALRYLKDGLGQYTFRDEIAQGKLDGIPFVASNTVPVNLGAGTNLSRLMLVDAAQVYWADDVAPRIDMSTEATIKLDSAPAGSTTFSSAFQQDLVFWRLTCSHTWAVRYAKSVVVVDKVNYAGR